MILFKMQIRKLFCFSILILTLISNVTLARSEDSSIQPDQTSQILTQLIFTDMNGRIAKKWEAYLKDGPRLSNRFSSTVHQAALNNLKNSYLLSIENYDMCIKNISIECKKPSLLLNKLQKIFGNEYVHKNIDSIIFVITSIYMADSLKYCEDNLKEVLYREYLYIDAVKNYVEIFIDFTETLNAKDKQIISFKIADAKKYLDNFYYPYQDILTNTGLRNSLYYVDLNTRKYLDPALIEFFVHDQSFNSQCFPYEAIKALKSLK